VPQGFIGGRVAGRSAVLMGQQNAGEKKPKQATLRFQLHPQTA
jgi:hypothetical protein